MNETAIRKLEKKTNHNAEEWRKIANLWSQIDRKDDAKACNFIAESIERGDLFIPEEKPPEDMIAYWNERGECLGYLLSNSKKSLEELERSVDFPKFYDNSSYENAEEWGLSVDDVVEFELKVVK